MNGNEEFTAEKLKKVISDAYEELPRNQRKIADFILNAINEAAFLSVVEIGERCDVSKATVVRFAQRIGFDGFIEFRNALQAAVHKKYSYMDRFQLIAESDKDTLYKVARQDVENINQTMESIKLHEFERIINQLRASETIYTFGKGISALMATILAYSLNQVAVKSHTIVSDHLTFEEQLMFVGTEDALVVFSFPPYSKETINAAKLAHEKNISVVAITDSSTAPISSFSTHTILVKSENLLFTNSFAAISVVINAITTELSIRDKKKTLRFIKEINEMMNKGGHFEL